MDYVRIFKIIILSSLIGSIITIFILAVKKIFKDELSSALHYYIWMILVIKLLIPFGPPYTLDIYKVYEKSNVQNFTKELYNKTSNQLQNTFIKMPMPINKTSSLNKSISNQNIISKDNIYIEKILYFIWILGMVSSLIVLVLGYKKLNKIINLSSKAIKHSHKEILHVCMQNMNIRLHLDLLYSSQIASPSICSIIKPRILLPKNVSENISDGEFKYIVIHELCHLKNKDIIVNWLINFLSIVYWFNPILMYSFYRIRQDCELFCDYRVIRLLNDGENVKYGNTLIKILELCGNKEKLAIVTPLLANSSEIKRRIIMISKHKRTTIKSMILGGTLIAIIGALSIAVNSSDVYSKVVTTHINTLKAANKNNSSNTTSYLNLSTDIKALQTNNSVSPFSSDVVIYNSHPTEAYQLIPNVNICDIGALVNSRLVNEGVNSKFIKCMPPKDYFKSYDNSRELITKNVVNYSNTALFDIHRELGIDHNCNTIYFVLAKKSPYYEKNSKLTNTLINYIKHSSKVETRIAYYAYGDHYFNQDLSDKSVLIEIGNEFSTDKNVEDCINALVSAINQVNVNLKN